MLFLHSCPVDKAISIVYKEHHEADDDRNVRNILDRGKCPKDYKHDIVYCISEREIRASARRKANCGKARRYRNGARQKVCGAELLKNKVKKLRNDYRQNKNNNDFSFVDLVYRNLALFSFVGVS